MFTRRKTAANLKIMSVACLSIHEYSIIKQPSSIQVPQERRDSTALLKKHKVLKHLGQQFKKNLYKLSRKRKREKSSNKNNNLKEKSNKLFLNR
jgi:hypothetical protein